MPDFASGDKQEIKMNKYIRLITGIFLLCLMTAPVFAETTDDYRFYELGERSAALAMEKLDFEYGDSDVACFTDAGRVLINGHTTQKAISGITHISGLQNSDETLFQINRADSKPLWFYFYNKNTGKGLYLEPAERYYSMTKGEIMNLAEEGAFSKVALVTGDIDKMLANTEEGDATQKALGENAFSLLSLSNAWAHGAPYDLMYAASLHNHFCPGVSSGYILVKYVEENLPLTKDTSYVAMSAPTWCKEDIFPTIWDMTPGKGGVLNSVAFTSDDQAYLTEKYGTRPAGIFVLWNEKTKTGTGTALGFNFDSSVWTGPSWGEKVSKTVDMVENLDNYDKYVTVMNKFLVDEKMLAELKNPQNNPYAVCGMM